MSKLGLQPPPPRCALALSDIRLEAGIELDISPASPTPSTSLLRRGPATGIDEPAPRGNAAGSRQQAAGSSEAAARKCTRGEVGSRPDFQRS